MTVLTFPTLSIIPRPSSLEWGLQSNTLSFTSPLNGTVQTLELPGARWKASFILENLPASDSALMEAFLIQLRGQAGRFYLWNFARETPRGSAGGTPLVNGAGQSGTSLIIDGCAASQTNWMLAGDYFGVNGELKMLTAPVNTNGSGQATLVFEPPLRSSPADNAAITLTKPICKMMLASNTVRWNVRAPILSNVQIDCMEQF